MEEEILVGGQENEGKVVRVGDTVRRPRSAGYEVVEALLEHLANVGFDEAPRLLGVDEHARQILEYIKGDTYLTPPWQQNDAHNAEALGQIAGWLRRLHDATFGYRPPENARPKRPLPVIGETWTHGDVGYPNVVYQDRRIVGLIDWEFAAPADRCCDLAALIATAVRAPRPDATDNHRREQAVRRALTAVAAGYGLMDSEAQALPAMAATIIDDLVSFGGTSMNETDRHRWNWRAAWFRENSQSLSTH